MITDILKKKLQTLADAQLAFEINGWERVDSIQKTLYEDSSAWGVVYAKDGKKFYLNIDSADKALQLVKRIP